MLTEKPLPCPFCGAEPDVQPINPSIQGNCWGMVECHNPECPAQPTIHDGILVADNRGSDEYINAAIRRWNIRYSGNSDS